MDIEKRFPFSPYTLHIKIGELEVQEITDEYREMVGTAPRFAQRFPCIFALLDNLRQQTGARPFPAC